MDCCELTIELSSQFEQVSDKLRTDIISRLKFNTPSYLRHIFEKIYTSQLFSTSYQSLSGSIPDFSVTDKIN
ncbi:unnamed protein product [Allacma fusca]|uniref:Uncharacterized protein n=1 Tax=Allacma fusca TaxID=39272 RepID=A0A8J2NM15_9HEXA|nr:unnamed protein product [Allacma fusca]